VVLLINPALAVAIPAAVIPFLTNERRLMAFFMLLQASCIWNLLVGKREPVKASECRAQVKNCQPVCMVCNLSMKRSQTCHEMTVGVASEEVRGL
jgi:hypothetical protein